MARLCSRQGCSRGATATLTYAYGDSTVVIGPLSRTMEPHSYDLCQVHANNFIVPQGWNIMYLNYESSQPDEEGLMSVHKAAARSQVPKEEFSSVRDNKDSLDVSKLSSKRKKLRALGERKKYGVAKPRKQSKQN